MGALREPPCISPSDEELASDLPLTYTLTSVLFVTSSFSTSPFARSWLRNCWKLISFCGDAHRLALDTYNQKPVHMMFALLQHKEHGGTKGNWMNRLGRSNTRMTRQRAAVLVTKACVQREPNEQVCFHDCTAGNEDGTKTWSRRLPHRCLAACSTALWPPGTV